MSVITYDDYIWGDKFKLEFESLGLYSNIDYVYSLNSNLNVVITHNGDYAVDDEKIKYFKNLKYWFGQNIISTDPRAIPIPIGLENDYIYYGKPNKKIYLFEKSKVNFKPSKLCYLNCNIQTYPIDRLSAYNYFQNQTWCTTKSHNSISYAEFCNDILDHKFIISPRGNGLDCHRTWEALYLKKFIIMKNYPGLVNLYSDLPVIFVNSWNEVSENMLNEKFEFMKNQIFNYEKLKISYWIDLIKKSL